MNSKILASVVASVPLIVLAPPGMVLGQTANANLAVTATVVKNCTITTTPVAFGNYDPAVANATVPKDGQGKVTVTCTRGVTATIGIDTGTHATRFMASGGNNLNYELYKDSGRATVWGTSGGAVLNVAAAPSTASRDFDIFGRVASGQDIPQGSYSDTAVVTITF